MWAPNQIEALVKMLCHKGPVLSLAVDRTGKYMVTAGVDGQMKVWDVRKFQPVNQYFTIRPAASMDLSQNGLLAVGCGPHVQIWKDAVRTKAKSPYMNHMIAGEEVRYIVAN